jgi:hypothetical protein
VAWERRTEQPMLDLSLFRNPRFTAASASVAISFFALSGFIFLVTQYFQFLKGYGPLSTGVRLLPVAIIRRDLLDPRHQARRPVRHQADRRLGLFSMAAFYLWVTTASADRLRDDRRPDGRARDGMGLTSAPATEAIMGVVPKAKAGVGSAVNDATRLLGRHPRRRRDRQRLRLAVRQPAHQRAPRGAAGHDRRTAHASVGAALTSRRQADPRRPSGCSHQAIHNAANSAFFQASTRPTTSPPASPPQAP